MTYQNNNAMFDSLPSKSIIYKNATGKKNVTKLQAMEEQVAFKRSRAWVRKI